MASKTTSLFYRCMQFFSQLLYHQFAWTYDWVAAAVSLGRWKDWVMTALPYLEGPCVLETGFGPGHLQQALHRAGVKTFGLDASMQMCRSAFLRLNNDRVLPLLVNGYTKFIPFKDSTFNQIAATFPTDYVFQPDSLAEFWRVLKPGGKLVVIPFAWIGASSWLERAAAAVMRSANRVPPDTQELNERLLQPFTQAGFQTQIIKANVRSSLVAIIIATRPDSATPERLEMM